MTRTVFFDTYTWIEHLDGNLNVSFAMHDAEMISSPIVLYEVFSKYLAIDEKKAAEMAGWVQAKSRLVNVDKYIALRAAQLRKKYKFSMADSIILSTAIQEKAELVTGDPHFKNVTEVKIRFL